MKKSGFTELLSASGLYHGSGSSIQAFCARVARYGNSGFSWPKWTKKTILLAMLLFGVIAAGAQTIQEYEEKLKTASDDQRPAILNQLAQLYIKTSSDKSISYAEQALKAARQTGDIDEEVSAQLNLVNGFETQENYPKAIVSLQAAAAIFTTYNYHKNAAMLWNRIGDDYVAENDLQNAIGAHRQAISLFTLAKDTKGALSAKMDIADIYSRQEKYQEALAAYSQLQKTYEANGDATMLVKTLGRIGSTYSNWGNFDEGITRLNAAIDIAKRNKMTTELQALQKSLSVVIANKASFGQSQTGYAKEKQRMILDEVNKKQEQITTLSAQEAKSIEEIGKLSAENQLKEFKLKAQNDELIRQKLEAVNKSKEIQLLTLDKEIKAVSIQKQRQSIMLIVAILILVVVFAIFIFRSLLITKKQKVVIQRQKLLADKINKNITDSIKSALTIQEAILPKAQVFEQAFRDSFVLFLPKDIVSGDFYWVKKTGSELLYSVIDCTGHGVPGAFMSLHAYNQLEYIVTEKGITSPSQVLNELNKGIVQTMKEAGDELFVKSGMDMGLVKLDRKNGEVEFSGAKHSLVIIRNKEIIELHGDSLPIGNTVDSPYTLQRVAIFPDDMLYLFSDGYKDQRGGANNKSLYSKSFKAILIELSAHACAEQRSILYEKHLEWKKTNMQNDDICVMGVRI